MQERPLFGAERMAPTRPCFFAEPAGLFRQKRLVLAGVRRRSESVPNPGRDRRSCAHRAVRGPKGSRAVARAIKATIVAWQRSLGMHGFELPARPGQRSLVQKALRGNHERGPRGTLDPQ